MWDEEKGEFEEGWLAWVTKLMAVLSLKWGPGGGGGSGRRSVSWAIFSELLEEPMTVFFTSLPPCSGPSRLSEQLCMEG